MRRNRIDRKRKSHHKHNPCMAFTTFGYSMSMRKRKQTLIIVAVAAVLLMAFSLLGRIIAPSWQPVDSTATVTLDSSDTSIAANNAVNAAIDTYDVDEQTVTVHVGDGVTVNAIVRTPRQPQWPDAEHPKLPSEIPGCMFITGAGLAKATDVYGDLAWDMASAGVATIVPDKRMDNYSWQHRDYVQMAHDYEQSLDALENWVGIGDGADAVHVSKTNVGLYAESEGTWITPIIASERSDVSFSIMTSAPVFTPREQMTYAMDDYFRKLNVPFPTNHIISRLTTLDMGSIGPNYGDFDVTPYLKAQTQPTLFIYGTNDLSMPTIEAPATARSLMADAGNTNTLLRYYKGANHQMRVGDAKAEKSLPLAKNFERDITDFALDAQDSTTQGWATAMTAGDDTPWQASAVMTDLSENGVGGGMVHSVDRLAVLQVGALLLLIVCGLTVPALHASRKKHIHREMAVAQLAANCSPDSAETGNVVVKYDELAKESRRRPGFAPGMATRLWTLGALTFATTLAWLGYIVYVALGVFGLTANSTVMTVWQDAVRVLALLCTIAFAALIVTMTQTAMRHRKNPWKARPAVAGIGHYVWIAVYTLAIILSFFMFMFWDIFLV